MSDYPGLEKIYEMSAGGIFSLLQTSEEGLSDEEATRRLKAFGKNEIEAEKKIPLYYRFLSNFTHFFAVLLWVAAGLSFVAGMPELGWAVIAVILINGVFSYIQEFKAEKATEALKKLLPYHIKAMRGKNVREVQVSELVCGDLIVLGEGDKVPADACLIEAFDFQVDNSVLTGESRPVRKASGKVSEHEGSSFREMPNLVFAGTSVVSGNAKAVIFATGMKTEFGKIAGLTQAVKADLSPMQKEMIFVTKVVAGLAVGMGIVFYLLGSILAGLSQVEAFIFAIGIIVANVPEGLLPTVTLALAMGVQRMADRNALVKKLSAVETLGSCSVICTDKTGTLTQNEMTVRSVWAGEEIDVTGAGYRPEGEFVIRGKKFEEGKSGSLSNFLKACILCNNARLIAPPSGKKDKDWRILGDPTEAALLVAAEKFGLSGSSLKTRLHKIAEIPFDSVRKRMSVVYEDNEGIKTVWVKGAPSEVIKRCSGIELGGKVVDFSPDLKREALKANDVFAKKALRVLAMAYRETGGIKDYTADELECGMIFTGLAAMMDPPRTEVKEAVSKCFKAGIRIVMITGDYGLTAEAIARKIGIAGAKTRIVNGQELERMTEEKLAGIISNEGVIFARVAPESKMRIVSAFQRAGYVVAVTGDGVNDAPALKKADIGIAMGIAGTDVAKEAADIILLDDNFATIVNAAEEGRAVYDNIRKFVTYIFASNIPEIIPYLLFVLSGGAIPLPLTVLQILAVDLGTDLFPALALGTEKPEPGVMLKPPRPRKERLLNKSLLWRAYGFLGVIEAAACMGGYFFAFWNAGWRIGSSLLSYPVKIYNEAKTMCLAGVVTTQIGNGFNCRSEKESVFRLGLFSNKLYGYGIISELVLIALFVYLPFFQKLFGHTPLGIEAWMFLFLWTPLIMLMEEVRKYLSARYKRNSKMKEA